MKRAFSYFVIASFTFCASSQAAEDGCINDIMRDALFIHATVACGTNYMDTPSGYAALAGSKECIKSMSDKKFISIAKDAMRNFDVLSKKVGIHQACLSVDEIRKCMETGEGCAER
jgi:hypothetical protein